MLKQALNSTRYLFFLVNDILTFSQIKNEIDLKYDFKKCNIREEIQTVFEIL